MDGWKWEAGDLSQVYGHKTSAKCKTRRIIGSLFFLRPHNPFCIDIGKSLSRDFFGPCTDSRVLVFLSLPDSFFFIHASMSKYMRWSPRRHVASLTKTNMTNALIVTKVRSLFEMAREAKPAIIFVDEAPVFHPVSAVSPGGVPRLADVQPHTRFAFWTPSH